MATNLQEKELLQKEPDPDNNKPDDPNKKHDYELIEQVQELTDHDLTNEFSRE